MVSDMWRFVLVGFAPDLSLCMFAWEAVSVSTDASAQRSCFLAIFDMNQFYNAQIPSAIRFVCDDLIDL